MTTPFDFINSISSSSENQILSGELDPSEYNSFMVNRGLSLHMDTVLYANELNLRPDIPAEAQYHFLHTLISKRKRWAAWPKKMAGKGDEKLFKVLRENYRFSTEKCIEIANLLSDEQKKEVIEEFEIIENKKRKSNGKA